MSDFIKWGKAGDNVFSRWPKNEDGSPVKPAILCNVQSPDMVDEITVNMLEACGIPCLRQYPGDGVFGKVILGMSGEGSDIYVPETMLEDAAALMSGKAEIVEE